MPSNPVPNLSDTSLKHLYKLLSQYKAHIQAEQPLAGTILAVVLKWIDDDIS
jgi:hypothetical protein